MFQISQSTHFIQSIHILIRKPEQHRSCILFQMDLFWLEVNIAAAFNNFSMEEKER